MDFYDLNCTKMVHERYELVGLNRFFIAFYCESESNLNVLYRVCLKGT